MCVLTSRLENHAIGKSEVGPSAQISLIKDWMENCNEDIADVLESELGPPADRAFHGRNANASTLDVKVIWSRSQRFTYCHVRHGARLETEKQAASRDTIIKRSRKRKLIANMQPGHP